MSTEKPETPPRLRIASYNIRKGIGLDRARRPERALEVLCGIDADVVAVQEADRRLGARPAALIDTMIRSRSDYIPVPVATNEVSLGWHGNAILIKPSLEVSYLQRVELPSFEPRGAVLLELTGAANFRIVATHLGLMRRHRREQIHTILAAIESRPVLPTIILGDFNEWSRSKGLEAFERNFTVHSPGKSYHASRPVAALDKFVTSREITLQDAGVEERGLARIASDHLPVWMDFTVQG